MRKLLWVFVLALVALSTAPAQVSANVGMFYSSLSPHGEWISVDGGTYAWRPRGIEATWRPYYYGEWVWTDDGWYWASDEPWGWATYHYGRWYFDDFYGWCWIPGYEWAPAWVEWRYGGAYVGWAPLGPYAVFSIGWGIHYRRYWATPAYYWSFVDCRYVTAHSVHRHVYRTEENARFIGRTRTGGSVRYDNGRIITRGPDRDYVEQRGKIRVDRADIVDVHEREKAGLGREGERERIAVYRPKIEGSDRGADAVRPERVRSDGRPINLDIRGTDIKRTDVDREAGRDLQRSEQFRRQREADRARPDPGRLDEGRSPGSVRPSQPEGTPERPVTRPDRGKRDSERPGYDTRVPRGERRVERDVARPRDTYERPRIERERQAPTPRVDREAPRPSQSVQPRGGGMNRPESARPAAPSTGGGSRGGERGGERSGRR